MVLPNFRRAVPWILWFKHDTIKDRTVSPVRSFEAVRSYHAIAIG